MNKHAYEEKNEWANMQTKKTNKRYEKHEWTN